MKKRKLIQKLRKAIEPLLYVAGDGVPPHSSFAPTDVLEGQFDVAEIHLAFEAVKDFERWEETSIPLPDPDEEIGPSSPTSPNGTPYLHILEGHCPNSITPYTRDSRCPACNSLNDIAQLAERINEQHKSPKMTAPTLAEENCWVILWSGGEAFRIKGGTLQEAVSEAKTNEDYSNKFDTTENYSNKFDTTVSIHPYNCVYMLKKEETVWVSPEAETLLENVE